MLTLVHHTPSVDLPQPPPADDVETSRAPLRLVWRNPNPPEPAFSSPPKLIAECRSRRQAGNILALLDCGWVAERRQGDRLIFFVYEGRRAQGPAIESKPEYRPAA